LQDPKISHLIQQLQDHSPTSPRYSWHIDEPCYKDCLYLNKQSQHKSMVLFELHASPTVGHSGFTKTYEWVKCSFFWDGMKQDVHTFVAECDVCQCNKGETIKDPGHTPTTLIPLAIWRDISMDFIVGLPKSGNKSIIMVVVDRLSKYAHFCALQHPFTTSIVAQIFMDNIFKLHGMPHSIVSDKIPLSPTIFGKNFQAPRNPIASQHAYHPQTDGQIEVVNKCLETYL
jgi:hypothetical protein